MRGALGALAVVLAVRPPASLLGRAAVASSRPSLLNRHALHAAEPAETAAAAEPAAAEPAATDADAEVKLADADAPAPSTVQHVKTREPTEAPAAPAPDLDEAVGDLAEDTSGTMDGVLETVLAPSVVEGVVGEQVERIESKYAHDHEEKPQDASVDQTALLAALAWLATIAVSLTVYWMILFVEFLLMGFVWAFLCMGRNRAGKPAAKAEFGGDFQPVGICAWMGAPLTAMLEAACCPHFLWAETVGKLGVVEFPPTLFLVLVLVVLVPVPYYLGFLLLGLPARVAVRTYIRRNYKQAGANRCSDCCIDVFLHTFCCCCAVHQEAQFIEQHQTAFAV